MATVTYRSDAGIFTIWELFPAFCSSRLFLLLQFFLTLISQVFVLDDGGETDLDLGNYERFMGVNLRNESNLTTG